MSHPAWIDAVIADVEKLFTHSDPAVPAAAQSIVAKLEAGKAEALADAKALGSEAATDARTLLTHAEQDAATIAQDATGTSPAAPAAQ